MENHILFHLSIKKISLLTLVGKLMIICLYNGWIDGFRVYVLFNSISVIPQRWDGDNERLCSTEPRLQLEGSSRPRFFNPDPPDQQASK